MRISGVRAPSGLPSRPFATLLAFDFHDLAASILAALRANPVGLLVRPTVGTQGQRPYREVVVGPALARPRLGMPAFGIGHIYIIL